MSIRWASLLYSIAAIHCNGIAAGEIRAAGRHLQNEPMRIIIQYNDDSFLSRVLDFSVDQRMEDSVPKRKLVAIRIRDQEVFDELRNRSDVVDIAIDGVREAAIFGLGEFATLSDEIVPYGIPMVQADQLNDFPEVDQSLSVCVVDTGYDLGHSDLPRVVDDVTGTNTLFGGRWNVDGNGHGTHCAGTVGAIGNNGRGVVGVRDNPNTFAFHIGKGLSDEGSGLESSIIRSVQGCIDNGARVISMSLGGPGFNNISADFYRKAYEEDGVLIIAAAGNEGTSQQFYPASYPHVMSVAAIDENENRASFSQCNDQVEIAAPGVDVLSTFPPDRYRSLSGTSQACPHVAGVAAEIWARFPTCTNTQIRNILLRTAKKLDDGGCHNGFGSGLVQARAAFDLLNESGCSAGDRTDGGPDVTGGCTQNPDFVESENPNFGKCGARSGANKSNVMSFFSFIFLVVAPLLLIFELISY